MALDPAAAAFVPGGARRAAGGGVVELDPSAPPPAPWPGYGQGGRPATKGRGRGRGRGRGARGGRTGKPRRTGKEEEETAPVHPEVIVGSPSGRGTAANHLLNFRLPARDRPAAGRGRAPKSKARAFDKDLFLLGSYRFLVSDAVDQEQELGQDRMVDWQDVVVVEAAQSGTFSRCPICLEEGPELVSAQITPCGHVFCFPCVMRYLMLEKEGQASKCPVCNALFARRELRHAAFRMSQPLQVGSESAPFEFTLVSRAKGSCKVEAAAADGAQDGANPISAFAKFSLTDNARHAHERAVEDLCRAAEGQTDEGMACIYAALVAVQDRAKAWAERRCDRLRIEVTPSMLVADPLQRLEAVREEIQRKEEFPTLQFDDLDLDAELGAQRGRAGSHGRGEGAPGPPAPPAAPQEAVAGADDSKHLIYQGSNGEPVFLDQLMMRCLRDFHRAAMPPRIAGKVLQLTAVEQTDATRKRHRAFSHLPLYSRFFLAEIDLSGTLPPEALAPFRDELDKRRGARRRQHQREEKERRRLEREAASKSKAQIRGPSLEELRKMPHLTPQVEAAPGEAEPLGDLSLSPEPVSFSSVAKWGLASGMGMPSLRAEQTDYGVLPDKVAAPSSSWRAPGAWGGGTGGAAAATPQASAAAGPVREQVQWKKKGKKLVLDLSR